MDFANAPASVRLGRWLFRHRTLKCIALLPAFAFRLEVEWETLTWPLGMGVLLAGAALRLWSVGHLGRSTRTRKDNAKRLVTAGPFSRCRNPIYLANMIGTSGFVVLCEAIWYLPIYLLISFSFYSLVVRYEEYLLSHKFPEQYAAYMGTIPRWIPRVRAYKSTKPDHGFGEILSRERSFFMLLAAALCVAISKEAASHLLR